MVKNIIFRNLRVLRVFVVKNYLLFFSVNKGAADLSAREFS
jgi:hypothetical protein